MQTVNLSTGNSVLNPLLKESAPADSEQRESTSGAMTIKANGTCPKCNKPMGLAYSGDEQVYYCEQDRVSLPLPIVD